MVLDRVRESGNRGSMNMRTYKIKATPNLKFAIALVLLLFLSAGFLSGFLTARWTSPAQGITPAPSQTPQETVPAMCESIVDCSPYIPNQDEVEALARMLYGGARGIASDMEKAACVWCVLNRIDDPRFPDTVLEVLEAPNQFVGYSPKHPLLPELVELATDVLTRYNAEKQGENEVGRVLPTEYCFFTGDGRNNHFVKEWGSENRWDWSLASPYEVTP